MSFLRSQGHPHAARYPLCTLWTEARIARHRVNTELATQAILIQSAIGSAIGGKEGQKHFNELTQGLTNGP